DRARGRHPLSRRDRVRARAGRGVRLGRSGRRGRRDRRARRREAGDDPARRRSGEHPLRPCFALRAGRGPDEEPAHRDRPRVPAAPGRGRQARAAGAEPLNPERTVIYYLVKLALSAGIIVVVSEVAKLHPGLGALIKSLPLVSILAMIWLWIDTHDGVKIG